MENFNKVLGNIFNKSELSVEKKIENFPRFVNRRDVATFLNRYEIFKSV